MTVLHTRPITIDPALQGDLLPLISDGLTRDELITYDHAPGSAGTRLVPDLALNVPLPTDGGTTYTFRLRPGIRYSDGTLVRAADYPSLPVSCPPSFGRLVESVCARLRVHRHSQLAVFRRRSTSWGLLVRAQYRP